MDLMHLTNLNESKMNVLEDYVCRDVANMILSYSNPHNEKLVRRAERHKQWQERQEKIKQDIIDRKLQRQKYEQMKKDEEEQRQRFILVNSMPRLRRLWYEGNTQHNIGTVSYAIFNNEGLQELLREPLRQREIITFEKEIIKCCPLLSIKEIEYLYSFYN